jgi:hypothetical protein
MSPWLIPSPLVEMLTRRVVVGERAFGPKQLAAPEVVAKMPRKVRHEAAKVALDRIAESGKHMATLRKRPVSTDIAIPNGFQSDELSLGSRAVFRRVLNGAGLADLQNWTWGQLLDSRRFGVPRVSLMSAMAELEWRLRQRESCRTERLTNTYARQIGELLADERLDAVQEDDLRFGWRRLGAHGRLSELLAEWKARQSLTSEQARFVKSLHRAFQMTLAEDIEDIGRALATKVFDQKFPRTRATEVFAARYGARPYGPQLEAIAKRHACSGSRVGQLDGTLLKARDVHSLVSPAALAMLNKVRGLAFMEASLVEQAAGLTESQGHSLGTFRRFCMNVLRPSLAFDIGSERCLGELRQGIAADSSQASPFKSALRFARRESRISGATNITSVAGALALDTGLPVSRRDLERMVDELPQTTWLDREHGWFSVNDVADSLVRSRVRKILAVAVNGVSIREIGEALYRDAKFADESGGEAGLAPLRILKQAILSWPDGVKEDARGFLYDPSGLEAAEVLSPLELQMFAALADRGGVATANAVVKAVGGNAATVRTALSYAVFAYPLGNGLYALRGWPIVERDLLSALADKVSQRGEDEEGDRRSTVMVIRAH